MARHVTISAELTESAILALGAANNACEGRIYPASDIEGFYIGRADGTVLGPIPGEGSGGGGGGTFAIPGPYANDAAAAAGGVAVGHLYKIAQANEYGIVSPGGITPITRAV